MYRQEEIKPYSGHESKGKQVEHMFDQIAHSYDTLNHRLSWDIDKRWRREAIKKLLPYKPDRILDVATGTGDFAILSAKMLRPSKLIGIDLSEGMMDIGKKKVSTEKLGNVISFVKGDCLALPFADESFDAVTSAFGIRNFESLDKGLKEMYRVLKKGGALCIIELTTPVCFPMKQLFKIYSHTILPMYGRIISKDKDAYRYLTASIEAFPQGETMVGIIKSAGFNAASFKRMTFGICTIYIATK